MIETDDKKEVLLLKNMLLLLMEEKVADFKTFKGVDCGIEQCFIECY